MAKRVSVNADALKNLIDSARSDQESLISEYCVSKAEEMAIRADLEKLLVRLDVKPI